MSIHVVSAKIVEYFVSYGFSAVSTTFVEQLLCVYWFASIAQAVHRESLIPKGVGTMIAHMFLAFVTKTIVLFWNVYLLSSNPMTAAVIATTNIFSCIGIVAPNFGYVNTYMLIGVNLASNMCPELSAQMMKRAPVLVLASAITTNLYDMVQNSRSAKGQDQSNSYPCTQDV
mgnify:CR=1 FL=1